MKKLISTVLAASMLLTSAAAFAADSGTGFGGGPVNGSEIAAGTINFYIYQWEYRDVFDKPIGMAPGSYAGGGPTIDENGDCIVPMVNISRLWGYTCTDENNTITLENGNRTIVVPYDGDTAVIDGKTVDFPHEHIVPQYADWDSVIDNEIYFHYSYCTMLFGLEKVEWDAEDGVLILTENESTPILDSEREWQKSDAESTKELIAKVADTEPEEEKPEEEPYPPTDNRAPYAGTESQFSDIPDSSSLLNTCINELVAMGIIFGYDDGTFRPDNTITRAEAAAMFCRLMGFDETGTNRFSDVPQNTWYSGVVGAIAENGIMSGYDDGTFGPSKEITYPEILKMCYCILGDPGKIYSTVMSSAVMDGLTAELESFTANDAVTRGNMCILLSKVIDSYIITWETVDGSSLYNSSAEMTLWDYLNGTYPLKRHYLYSIEN